MSKKLKTTEGREEKFGIGWYLIFFLKDGTVSRVNPEGKIIDFEKKNCTGGDDKVMLMRESGPLNRAECFHFAQLIAIMCDAEPEIVKETSTHIKYRLVKL